MQERWKEWIEDLCDKNNNPPEEEEDMHLETDTEYFKRLLILFSDFEAAFSEAEGKDAIPAELLNALGAKGKRELCDICNEIYVNGECPDDFCDSAIIAIERAWRSRLCRF